MLHGFGGRPQVWEPTIAQLPKNTAVLCPALPGHDPHQLIEAGASFDSLVHRLAADLPERFDLLGYSLGARLALSLALSQPHRVRRLYLIGVHPGLDHPEERAMRREADATWARKLREHGLDAFFAEWDKNPLFHGRVRMPAEHQRALQEWRRQHDPEQLARALETLGLAQMPSRARRLADLEADTALIVGEDDDKFRLIAETLAAQLPRATVHLIEGAGHDVPLEAPEALAAFLTRDRGMG